MNLFKIPTDDVCRIYTHPLFQKRSVDTPEVDGMLKVFAVYPTGRIKGRILRIEPAFHVIPDDERTATGAVICAAGVVSDPAYRIP